MSVQELVNLVNEILDEELKYRGVDRQIILTVNESYMPVEHTSSNEGIIPPYYQYLLRVRVNGTIVKTYRFSEVSEKCSGYDGFVDECRKNVVKDFIYSLWYKKERGIENFVTGILGENPV